MKGAAYRWIHRVWYEGSQMYVMLLPLAGIYWLLVSFRRLLYRCGLLTVHRPAVPVIVVGNITAGGTGKTPTTLWVATAMRERGFNPGIVSRGYGGSRSSTPMRVDAASDPVVVGDEPVLLAKRSGCPIVVDADRCRAASMLIDDGADMIIADDGLQHYKLARDYEICVVDGSRGLGNRFLLPAGPLREPATRLAEVDQVLVNGKQGTPAAGHTPEEQNALEFELTAIEASRLNGSLTRPLDRFSGTTVHAVAAIGNPNRFFDLLRSRDIQVIEHAFPDHALLKISDIDFRDDFDILMTEKDAVKFAAQVPDRYWSVSVDLTMDPAIEGPWLAQIESRMRDVSRTA